MKAFILAGGYGTRIKPLNGGRPKPMIPLLGKPILQRLVEHLKKHGITDLTLLLHHQPEAIRSHFEDGSRFGVRIDYVCPKCDLGTAGAVKAASGRLDTPALVISGDLLTDFDPQALLRFHRQNSGLATLALTEVDNPLPFGIATTDSRGRICRFLEKPQPGELFSHTVNTGIYILEPEVLELIPQGQNRDWSKDIFPLMLKLGLGLYGCRMPGYWRDIGNPASYLEACHDIVAGRVQSGVEAEPGALLYRSGRGRGMVLVGPGSHTTGPALLENCIIGRNCLIEKGAKITDSVLWDNVHIREGACIQGAVLGHGTTVGRHAVAAPGAVLGDGNRIDSGTTLWPGGIVENVASVTGNHRRPRPRRNVDAAQRPMPCPPPLLQPALAYHRTAPW